MNAIREVVYWFACPHCGSTYSSSEDVFCEEKLRHEFLLQAGMPQSLAECLMMRAQQKAWDTQIESVKAHLRERVLEELPADPLVQRMALRVRGDEERLWIFGQVVEHFGGLFETIDKPPAEPWKITLFDALLLWEAPEEEKNAFYLELVRLACEQAQEGGMV